MDYITAQEASAYFIIYLLVAFIAFPCMFGPKFSTYKEAIGISFIVQGCLAVVLSVVFAALWAINVVWGL